MLLCYDCSIAVCSQCDSSGSFSTVITFECRGLEVTNFDPRVEFKNGHRLSSFDACDFVISSVDSPFLGRERRLSFPMLTYLRRLDSKSYIFTSISRTPTHPTQEWFEYDEKMQKPVSITELEFKFMRV